MAVPGGRGVTDWTAPSPTPAPVPVPAVTSPSEARQGEDEEPLPVSSSELTSDRHTLKARPRLTRSLWQSSRNVSREERKAIGEQNRALMAMPEEELTDEERTRVRQIVTLKLLKRMAGKDDSPSSSDSNVLSCLMSL